MCASHYTSTKNMARTLKRAQDNALTYKTPKKKPRTVAYTTDVHQIPRKQKGSFEPYSDYYFRGMPEDNARAMPMMTKDSVGWKQTKGAWAPEVPPPDKNYLRRTKVTADDKVTPCTSSNALTNRPVSRALTKRLPR